MTPTISYLTFVDKYVLMNFGLIFLLVVEGALAGGYEKKNGKHSFDAIDWVCLWVCIGLFVLIHLWALLKVAMTDRSRVDARKTLTKIDAPLMRSRMFLFESEKNLVRMPTLKAFVSQEGLLAGEKE